MPHPPAVGVALDRSRSRGGRIRDSIRILNSISSIESHISRKYFREDFRNYFHPISPVGVFPSRLFFHFFFRARLSQILSVILSQPKLSKFSFELFFLLASSVLHVLRSLGYPFFNFSLLAFFLKLIARFVFS